MEGWADQLGTDYYSLGEYAEAVERRLRAWAEADLARRLWAKDGTLWVSDPEAARKDPDLENRLGWLDLPETMPEEVAGLAAFADEIRDAWYTDAVVLGMGGSSLAPEVYARVFGQAEGYLKLSVLDSTHPQAVLNLAEKIKPVHTLFLVSSKSGGTLETLSLFKYFHEQVRELENAAGRNFVVITDPGSSLERLAREKTLRRVFPGPPDVGGRYSALTNFGLVPAALLGVPLRELLERAGEMARRCAPEMGTEHNPALVLGAVMGELALAGRDKVTLCLSPALEHFSVWAEQLIAESMGKEDKGIVPVPEPTLAAPESYGDDRLFVGLRLEGDDNAALEAGLAALEGAGHPVAIFRLRDRADLGAEFFRWEMATAAAGAALGINPFNQPNVQSAKSAAIKLMEAYQQTGELPAQEPALAAEGLEVYGGTGQGASLAQQVGAFLAQARPGDYVALMAYLAPDAATDKALGELRDLLRDRLRLAVTLGYGPRFLHSTGQLHKGDGNHGLFLQITQSGEQDLAIPGEPYSFGTLIAAQALGDYRALEERGRRAVRVNLSGAVAEGLEKIREAVEVALG